MAKKNDQYALLELQPWRVLVVAAHPGDIEYTVSAAVAKWTSEGAEVVYLIASRGETSMPGVDPEDAALIRSAEQSASAGAVGVQVVDFLDVDDGIIEPTVAIRRAIVNGIRRFRPDVVLVMNHREVEADGTRNNADHRAVGTAALDAVAAAANQWVFRDVGDPHVVDTVLIAASPMATHGIDVSGFEDAAIAALSTHHQHVAAVSPHPMTDALWLTDVLRKPASHIPSSTAAILVELVAYAQGRPCHSSTFKKIEDTNDHVRIMKLPRSRPPSRQTAAAKTSTRARNAAPATRSSRKAAKRPIADAAIVTGNVQFKARLEQNGKSIGIEVPESVMERLGGGKRPRVTVNVNETLFESLVGANNGRRFVPINADRRKAAAIAVNDTFFVTISVKTNDTKETLP